MGYAITFSGWILDITFTVLRAFLIFFIAILVFQFALGIALFYRRFRETVRSQVDEFRQACLMFGVR